MKTLVVFLLLPHLLLAGDLGNWRELRFDGIPPNRVAWEQGVIDISVARSGSPLVNVIPHRRKIRRIMVDGNVKGQLRLQNGCPKDERFGDALLRVGVITPGGRRLNPLQRRFAPEWLRSLDRIFGDDKAGLGEIRCGLLQPHPDWIGGSRNHPQFEFFREQIVAAPDRNGQFRLVLVLPDAPQVLGLWLQADGDNTESTFRVVIDRITIEGPEKSGETIDKIVLRTSINHNPINNNQ